MKVALFICITLDFIQIVTTILYELIQDKIEILACASFSKINSLIHIHEPQCNISSTRWSPNKSSEHKYYYIIFIIMRRVREGMAQFHRFIIIRLLKFIVKLSQSMQLILNKKPIQDPFN